MARLARLYVPAQPQNVVLRGLGQQSAFLHEDDYQFFLECLRGALPDHGLRLHAWTLLPNEVRLLATPTSATSLPKTIQAVGRRYVAMFNRRHARKGTIWEGRFRATVIEPERYLLLATRVIETAGHRAGLATSTGEYRWSSYRHHAGLETDSMITDHPLFWALGNTPFERQIAYKNLCSETLDEREVKALAEATIKGWVFGSASYREWAGSTANRRVTALPRGRPRQVAGPANPAAMSPATTSITQEVSPLRAVTE